MDQKYKPKSAIEQEKVERDAAKRQSRPYAAPAPATVYEDMSDNEESLPSYEDRRPHGGPGAAVNEPVRPAQAAGRNERVQDSGVGRPGSKNQRPVGDVEMGGQNRRDRR